jgi:hypothetical protein
MGYEASAEENFSRGSPLAERPRNGAARALADAEGGTGHGGECNLPSAFPQEIVVAAEIVAASIQRRRAAGGRSGGPKRVSDRIGASIAMM